MFVAIVLMSLIGCSQFLEVPSPATKAENEKVFANEQTANAAITGVYAMMVSANLQFFNGAITAYTGFSADEFSNPDKNTTYEAFRIYQILSNNELIASNFWANAYKLINHVNVNIEGLLRYQNTYRADRFKQLIGEMYFTRALLYFYLVNLFGEVPLILSTTFESNALLPRTGRDKVYQQMLDDLTKAAGNLSYGTSNLRPNKAAANLLLARVYLYLGNWEQADLEATQVIAQAYNLEAPANTFLMGSKETIFQLMKASGNTAEAFTFIPSTTTAVPTFTLTDQLYQAFTPTDLRKVSWLRSNTNAGKNYYYPFKYKVRSGTAVSEYYVVMRQAEAYLIRAEARAQLKHLGDALVDLEVTRKRAGLLPLSQNQANISQATLLSAIDQERRLEFFAEWGHRWLDLKRRGTASQVLGALKGADWKSTGQYFPIPFREIQYNPYLIQNDGYH